MLKQEVFIDLDTIESIVGKLLVDFVEVDDKNTLMFYHPIASLYYDTILKEFHQLGF
jgi:hypothetical protein